MKSCHTRLFSWLAVAWWVPALLLVGAAPVLAQGPVGGPVPTPSAPLPIIEQPGRVALHPIGIAFALLFIVLMINLFHWMFRVPPQVPYAVVKVRQSVSALNRILVPTMHDGASQRAVELACRLGTAQKAEIVLAYVIEVPFTLSLNTPLPAEESRGQDTLHTAQFIVQQHGLPVTTRLIPHRYLWGGITSLAREEQADAIVMSVDGAPTQSDAIGRTAHEVLKRAECEVILDRRAG
jgi:nucleotide-binding universal stress UspA family protein